jgi:microcompartment protein CcmL/EutN
MKMKNSIGIIELGSIYKGFEVQDMILKSSRIEKLLARTICSGKYLIMVRGEIADVESCLETAREIGGFAIISATLIPNIDEKIFPAITGSTVLNGDSVPGLILIETFSVAAAVKAADVAAQEADINVIRVHLAMAVGGKGFVVLTGNEDALKAALQPAIEYLKQEGMLAGYSLITNPHKELLRDLI